MHCFVPLGRFYPHFSSAHGIDTLEPGSPLGEDQKHSRDRAGKRMDLLQHFFFAVFTSDDGDISRHSPYSRLRARPAGRFVPDTAARHVDATNCCAGTHTRGRTRLENKLRIPEQFRLLDPTGHLTRLDKYCQCYIRASFAAFSSF